jgi:DNA polymerase IV
MPIRAIVHVDMDAFYAAVEQRDRPELAGQPVIVGADPRGRGVVAAASYEARRFGVHSAMPIGRAYRLCPHGVYLPVDMARYARVSAELMAILGRYTPLVEPLSLDEAFLDVTASEALFGPAVAIARAIKDTIRGELRLTASAGVAPNKFLAKIASDLRKPDGLVEVRKGEEAAFLRDLPIGRLWGVGPAVEEQLAGLGIQTIGALARLPRQLLVRRMGRFGAHLWALARGQDERPVIPWEEPKSVGAEETFERDTADTGRLRVTLLGQADRVASELRGLGLLGRTVTLKLRYADFRTVTRRETSPTPTADGSEIFRRAWEALARLPRPQPIRLIGLSVSGLARQEAPRQLPLFDRALRAEAIGRLADDLRARFGPGTVRRASAPALPPRPPSG